MRKLLLTIIVVAAMLLSTNVSYGDKVIIDNVEKIVNNVTNRGGKGGEATVDIVNRNRNINRNNIDVDASSNQQQGQLQGQLQGQGQSQTNEGNKVDIQDNSSYTEITPTDLLDVHGNVPLADKLLDKDMHTSKSIFKLQRSDYTCKELTRFANPGQFFGIFWPEWSNTYTIEIATFAKYKAVRNISVLTTPVAGLTKIGEAQASAKDLGKSEHQVMAALAVRCAEAGATTIVFKGFSRPLVTVDSFVVGGGGVQVGSPQSVFNGATGIGSSTSEALTRACVVAELYRSKESYSREYYGGGAWSITK